MSKIKETYNCALILTNDLIGGKWKLRILWHIIHGDNRYSLLAKGIPDITPKVLSSQLRELETSNIVEKTIVEPRAPKIIIYNIKKEYESLIPIIESICHFTREYAKENAIVIKGE